MLYLLTYVLIVMGLLSMKINWSSIWLFLQPRCSVSAMTPGSIGPVKKETSGKKECLYVLAFSCVLADCNSCSKSPQIVCSSKWVDF